MSNEFIIGIDIGGTSISTGLIPESNHRKILQHSYRCRAVV